MINNKISLSNTKYVDYIFQDSNYSTLPFLYCPVTFCYLEFFIAHFNLYSRSDYSFINIRLIKDNCLITATEFE